MEKAKSCLGLDGHCVRCCGDRPEVCKELSVVGCVDWEAVISTRTELQRPGRTRELAQAWTGKQPRTQRTKWALICTTAHIPVMAKKSPRVALHRCTWEAFSHSIGHFLSLYSLHLDSYAYLHPTPISRKAQPCHASLSYYPHFPLALLR